MTYELELSRLSPLPAGRGLGCVGYPLAIEQLNRPERALQKLKAAVPGPEAVYHRLA